VQETGIEVRAAKKKSHYMVIICTWHLVFWASHCMIGILDIRLWKINLIPSVY
jgi:hypothetical protein